MRLGRLILLVLEAIVYLEIGAFRTRGSYVEMHLVRKCKTGWQFVAVKGLGEPGQEHWLPSFRAGFRRATGGQSIYFEKNIWACASMH